MYFQATEESQTRRESEVVVRQSGSGTVPDASNNNVAAGESEGGDLWTYGPMEFSDGDGDMNESILDVTDD